MDSNSLITYSGYILFIFGSIFSFVKIKYEINKRKELEEISSLREKRYNVYKEFLSKLDVMNSDLYSKQFNKEAMDKVNDTIEKVKANPYDISGYYNLIQYQSTVLFDWMREFNKYLDELNHLRLVGSSELIKLLDRYQELVEKYLEVNAESILMNSTSLPSQLDFSIVQQYAEARTKLNEIRKQLEVQMRIDIGNS